MGRVELGTLAEISGVAASRQNPGVLWMHNDSGAAGSLYAIATSGVYLGRYVIPIASPGNYEDVAIGPGPLAGFDYIYLGDIGDNFASRGSIRVYRFPEPAVYLRQTNNPVFSYVAGADVLTLIYPDGPSDAEALMVDPITGDLFIATKLDRSSRVYRASREQLDAGGFIELSFVREIAFNKVSAGDISPDGTLVALRRGNNAAVWMRAAGQTIGAALAGGSIAIPVVGEPAELNGEALGFHGTGLGYYTVSEGLNQPIFYFARTDADLPRQPVTLIGPGETWRYRDLGQDEGTAWRQLSYDDSPWASGPAQLGYGQGDEATAVGYGNFFAKHTTTYFRKSFVVSPSASLRNASLRVCYTDGVAVYLNGTEVLRHHLDPNAPFDRLATGSSSPLQNCWQTVPVNPALLLAGTNVVAVELHRLAPSGADLSFDLQLLLGAFDADADNYSPDTIRPTVAFAAPSPNTPVTNAILAVRGSASDNVSVANVLWAVGTNEFQTAVGTRSWSASVPLEVGTNWVRILALDSRTNRSVIATRTFVRLTTSPLTVEVSGAGSVTPNLHDALLLVGKAYQVTARPSARHLFAGWSAGLSTNSPQLRFVMQSNLVLRANFITNFFIAVRGPYRGLFAGTGQPSHARSGAVALNLTESGKFSGSLRIGGSPLAVSGQFNYEGQWARTLSFQRTNLLTVSLGLDQTLGSESVTGLVAGVGWEAPLLAYRSPSFPKTNAAPFAARYTAAFLADAHAASGPLGHGVASILVAGSGSMTLAGTLADGSKAAFKGPVAPNGLLPLYVPLHRNRGSVIGWVRFTGDMPFSLAGDCRWIRPALPTDRHHSAAFTNAIEVRGSIYSSQAMTNFLGTNAGICLSVSGLTPEIQTNCVTPRSRNTFTGPAVASLKLDLPTGMWTGTYTNSATRTAIPLRATLLLPARVGYGHLLVTNLNAAVELAPNR